MASKPSATNSRGRPRVDATQLAVRVPPAELAQLDAWIVAQPEPKPSRPEAIRRLVEKGLAAEALPALQSDAALDTQITKQEVEISEMAVPEGKSPEAGLAAMDKAMAENDLIKLKNKRTRRKIAGGRRA